MTCYYQFGSNLAEEKYWKPKRNMATKEIRRLVVEGVPYQEIWKQLDISERSFYRYLNRAYKQDREAIAHKITNDDVLTQLAILRDKFQVNEHEVQQIARDTSIDPKVRLEARNMLANLQILLVKLFRESPAAIAAGNRNMLEQGQQQPLVVVQGEQQKAPPGLPPLPSSSMYELDPEYAALADKADAAQGVIIAGAATEAASQSDQQNESEEEGEAEEEQDAYTN